MKLLKLILTLPVLFYICCPLDGQNLPNQDSQKPQSLPTFSKAKKITLIGQEKLESSTFVDFDEDGNVDMISGNFNGNLIFRKNVSKGNNVELAAPENLKRNGKEIILEHW